MLLATVLALAAAVLHAAWNLAIKQGGDRFLALWGQFTLAGAIGLVVLGLFANDFGFLFTGQYVVLRDQVISCVLVAAYSMGVSMGLWCVLRRAFARTPVLQQS